MSVSALQQPLQSIPPTMGATYPANAGNNQAALSLISELMPIIEQALRELQAASQAPGQPPAAPQQSSPGMTQPGGTGATAQQPTTLPTTQGAPATPTPTGGSTTTRHGLAASTSRKSARPRASPSLRRRPARWCAWATACSSRTTAARRGPGRPP